MQAQYHRPDFARNPGEPRRIVGITRKVPAGELSAKTGLSVRPRTVCDQTAQCWAEEGKALIARNIRAASTNHGRFPCACPQIIAMV